MATKYKNTDLHRVPSEGGAIRLTVAGNSARANSSIPCKQVKVQSANVGVRVNFGAAASATLGILVPQVDQATDVWDELTLDTDDVRNLYFYGPANGETIDILYRL